MQEIAVAEHQGRFFLYLGRNIGLPVCLEGALKMKEISYIPSDAYAAGEMKHGPIALLDESTPVVCVATDSPVLDKVLSNVAEVRARGADVIAIATEGAERVADVTDQVVYVPSHRLGPPADPGDPPAPAARLPRGPPAGPERRPAAQPRQDGDRRVIARAALALGRLRGAARRRLRRGRGNDHLVHRARPREPDARRRAALRRGGGAPEGDQKDAVDSALSKLLATDDPGGFIIDQLDQRARGSRPRASPTRTTSHRGSGPRAGVFFRRLTDRGRRRGRPVGHRHRRGAEQAIDKAAASGKRSAHRAPTTASATDLGRPFGRRLVGDLLVSGPEAAFEDGGRRVAGLLARRFERLRGPARRRALDDQLAFAYLQPAGDRRRLEKSGPADAPTAAAAGPQLQTLLSQPATVSASATDDQVVARAPRRRPARQPRLPRSPRCCSDFPCDSWLAFAGSRRRRGARTGARGAGQQALASTSGWMSARSASGRATSAAYVRGTSLFGLGGALVVETSDEQASAQTLDQLRRALSRKQLAERLAAVGERGAGLLDHAPGGADPDPVRSA